ncbi:hypothetical protein ZWY2020_014844 [Hordeum vulgare]|nr:hypothetical protein ZWY2020_014844 [Hordeum vulgare]
MVSVRVRPLNGRESGDSSNRECISPSCYRHVPHSALFPTAYTYGNPRRSPAVRTRLGGLLHLHVTVTKVFRLGIIGAIYYGSALFSGIIITVLLPVTEVLAVVFFHEPFSGTKGVALGLSLWGLASYFYGEEQRMAPDAEHQSSSCVDRDCKN